MLCGMYVWVRLARSWSPIVRFPTHDMLRFLEKGSGFFHDSTGTSFCQRNFPVFSSFGCPALQTAPGSERDNQLYPDKGQFAVHDMLAWMTGAASVKDPKLPQNENSRSGLNGSIHVTLDVSVISYRICGLQ